jgi:2-polyprenyl-3-methyl-5-hydroxy-6-metoxy-1,4-benzoquinol methylase
MIALTSKAKTIVSRNPALKSLARKAIRSATYKYLDERTREAFAEFKDGRGNTFQLRKGIRDFAKPNWRDMYKSEKSDRPARGAEIDAIVERARGDVKKLVRMLGSFGFDVKGKTILEVGCYHGAHSFALAEAGAAHVIASDMTSYYVKQSYAPTDASQQDNRLEAVRHEVQMRFPSVADRVEFVEDDITQSDLETARFDLICSWEVMEHVSRPAEAIQQFHRLLRSGGYSFHEYNPFFCLAGGHSPCSMDFLWGHALLDAQDFARYVEAYRPQEASSAIQFFTHNLNRMTQAEAQEYFRDSGLRELAFVTFPEEGHCLMVTPEILERCRALYPSARFQDLVTPTIFALHQK